MAGLQVKVLRYPVGGGQRIEVTNRRRTGFHLRVRPAYAKIFILGHEPPESIPVVMDQVQIGGKAELHDGRGKRRHDDADDGKIVGDAQIHEPYGLKDARKAGAVADGRCLQAVDLRRFSGQD